MRRDLFIGLLVSLLLHAGLALGFNAKAPPPAKPEAEIPVVTLTLAPLEPDEPVPADTGPAASDQPSLAPPAQPDLPAVHLDSPFVQTLQPTAPSGLTRPATQITIPVGRAGGGPGGGGLAELFSLADLDQRPEPLATVNPVYPYEMRRAGVTGAVTVVFTVDTEGNVRDAKILRSTQREFEASALQAVLQWKFKPGKRAGRVVNTRMSLPIEFTLVGEH